MYRKRTCCIIYDPKVLSLHMHYFCHAVYMCRATSLCAWARIYPLIDVPCSYFLVHNFFANFSIMYMVSRTVARYLLTFLLCTTSYTLFTIALKRPLWRNVGYDNKLNKDTWWFWIIHVLNMHMIKTYISCSDPVRSSCSVCGQSAVSIKTSWANQSIKIIFYERW